MLSDKEKKQILQRFPDVELSYDKTLHKKVYADLFMIRPKGTPSFLWFTYHGGRNICILLQLNHKGNVKQLDVFPVCFDRELSYGTLLYGTYFKIGNRHYYTCEDIFLYQGTHVTGDSLLCKIGYIKQMFLNYVSQKAYNNKFLLVGLPVWCRSFNEAMNTSHTLPYSVYGIKTFNTKFLNKETLGIYLYNKPRTIEGVFIVQPTMRDDIYNIICQKTRDNNTIKYGTACVPSYRRSVELNTLFRNIKENKNLDLLEESDDEEEFQNVSDDKHVYLNRTYIMKCVYHKRFKKWEPIEVVDGKSAAINMTQAIALEKKV